MARKLWIGTNMNKKIKKGVDAMVSPLKGAKVVVDAYGKVLRAPMDMARKKAAKPKKSTKSKTVNPITSAKRGAGDPNYIKKMIASNPKKKTK